MDLPQKTNAAFVGPRDVKLCDTATTTILNTWRLAQVYVRSSRHTAHPTPPHHSERKMVTQKPPPGKRTSTKKLFVYDGDNRFIYFPRRPIFAPIHTETQEQHRRCVLMDKTIIYVRSTKVLLRKKKKPPCRPATPYFYHFSKGNLRHEIAETIRSQILCPPRCFKKKKKTEIQKSFTFEVRR